MKNCTGINCIMQFDKVDPATCKCVSYCPQATPPLTNADCIRSMSDEELADFIICTVQRGGYTPSQEPLRWLDWLRQEAT